ncbi:MAG: stage II sporulation protein P [Clostridiales bacterium]|jgi:stage II sporulation protein P|nr:stage II sporulation protein P [Clostridiales bacterium]
MKNKLYIVFLVIIIGALIFASQQKYDLQSDIPESGEMRGIEEEETSPLIAPFYPTFKTVSQVVTWEDKLKYLYTIDKTAYVGYNLLDIDDYVKQDLSTDLTGRNPKILIFHTHSQEDFIDSRDKVVDDTVVGLGNLLGTILVNKYHVPVLHDVGTYDLVKGKIQRDGSYERMTESVSRILGDYPSIEITIDLHRDGVPENVHLVKDTNGLPTARMMFFNGVTCLNKNGRPELMPELPNPYLRDNLALTLQLQLASNELYPGLMRQIYIKPYRYSLHLTPKSMLVEVGANTNTVQEAKNAMEPLAEILMSVLKATD